MFKKAILTLYVICSLHSVQIVSAVEVEYKLPGGGVYVFDAEKDSEFTKRKTVETWLAERFRKEKTIKIIQRELAQLVPENRFSKDKIVPIKNDEEVSKHYGYTFRTMVPIELPFLQFVHERSKKKPLVIVEFASGRGYVPWKAVLGLENGGAYYVNEFSSKMMKDLDGYIGETLSKVPGGEKIDKYIIRDLGDCLEFLKRHPELVGKVDAFYVQNLEHFFNVIEHSKFLKIVYALLAPKGRAFLSANSLLFEENNPVHKFYLKQSRLKKEYPGFVQFKFKSLHNEEGTRIYKTQYDRVERPKDGDSTMTGNMGSMEAKKFVDPDAENKKLIITLQLIRTNIFTPEVYCDLALSYPLFRVIDSFYINEDTGVRRNEWSSGHIITHAAVIIEKLEDEEAVSLGCAVGDECKEKIVVKKEIEIDGLADLLWSYPEVNDSSNIYDTFIFQPTKLFGSLGSLFFK